VAALTASAAVALLSMVAGYSLGRGQPKRVEERIRRTLKKSEELRKRFLDLVDLDARAYLQVAVARSGSAQKKRAAKRKAAAVPGEVARLCLKAMDLTPLLVTRGNPNLLSDVEVAVELLFAAYKSAMINVRVNQ